MERSIGSLGGAVLRTLVRVLAVGASTSLLGAAGIALFATLMGLTSGSGPGAFVGMIGYFLAPIVALPFVIVTAATLMVGLPVMVLFRKLEVETSGSYAFAGGAAGVALAFPLDWGSPYPGTGLIIFCCVAYGAVAAVILHRLYPPSNIS